jgi:hypothetical protein
MCDSCNEDYNIIYAKYLKNIKRNKFYNCQKCALKDRSKKFKEDNPSLNTEYQKKKIQTFIKRFGVDNPSKSNIIKDKKSKTTMVNYGVDNPLKLTNLVKYGMIKKYGVEFPAQSIEIKEKMIEGLIKNYGVDNISKIDWVKNKKSNTCLEKYGVKNPMQLNYFFEKQMHSAFKLEKYNNIHYQGTYELDFLNHCNKIGLIDLISNGPSIKYILESDRSNHTYHSDFYIEKYNLIIEVKSTYTYEYDIYKNKMKEKYSKLCGYNFLFIIDKDYSNLNKYVEL